MGETLIALKIQESEEKGMSFSQVIEEVEAYIAGQNTYFVLETLETLRKNGRLTGIKAIMATALNIKPVMGATPEGTICQLGQARGIKRALVKMVERVVDEVKEPGKKTIAVSHCNCPERAESVKRWLMERTDFKDVIVLNMAGISSMYAADGGIIVVV